MRNFVDPKVVSRLRGLALDARMPMIGSVSGRHRSPTRGSSLEFSEYRKYVPGDDTRRLDWRAWGRSDRFYIKEYEADTNLAAQQKALQNLTTPGVWAARSRIWPPAKVTPSGCIRRERHLTARFSRNAVAHI